MKLFAKGIVAFFYKLDTVSVVAKLAPLPCFHSRLICFCLVLIIIGVFMLKLFYFLLTSYILLQLYNRPIVIQATSWLMGTDITKVAKIEDGRMLPQKDLDFKQRKIFQAIPEHSAFVGQLFGMIWFLFLCFCLQISGHSVFAEKSIHSRIHRIVLLLLGLQGLLLLLGAFGSLMLPERIF